MDVAVIDWKDSIFVKDENLENINAPQWVDFFAPDQFVDDEAWFCRPDCKHPKTIDDFVKVGTPNSKLHRSASVSDIPPFGDRNRRDVALKKRGTNHASISPYKVPKYGKLVEDCENQNPNLSTPPNHKTKLLKEAIKSSTEKKEQVDSLSNKEETPKKLRSTLSARNLFAGRDILGHITDFCTEVKRLALRAKERENVEKAKKPEVEKECLEVEKGSAEMSPVKAKKSEVEKECLESNVRVLDERKPLLEVSKEKYEGTEKSSVKEKLRMKRRNDEAENTPIRVDLKNLGRKEDISSQIRTNPPTPQCFSAQRGATKTTAPQAFRARPQERAILQEVEQRNNKDVRKEQPVVDKVSEERHVLTAAEREAPRSLDVFWFLKPCQLSS